MRHSPRTGNSQPTRKKKYSRHRNQPRTPRGPTTPDLRTSRQLPLQPPSESRRDLDHPLVAIQPDHIARPFQHRPALCACLEVLVHGRAQAAIHLAVEIVRHLPPHDLAVHCSPVHHGLLPFSNGSRLNQPCSQPPASRSRNISRARSSLVFTEATEIPSASAVS